MIDYLNKIKDLNILIIGEIIIDEYQYGHTLGRAGKFPGVTFQGENEESYDGGVLAIRNHLKEFCKKIDIYTWHKTVHKKRYIQANQKLFETYSYGENIRTDNSIIPYLKKGEYQINDYDLIIVADFGHGFINKQLRDDIQKEAKFIALNVQNNSGNMGMSTINKYSIWNYISIDEIELRLSCSNQFEDLKQLIHEKFNGLDRVVSITENKNGSYVYKNGKIIQSPALAKDIVDTIGAGDAYFALTSPLAYINAPIEVIGKIGNIAGAIACGYPGNKEYVTKEKMLKFIKEELN